MKRQLSPYSATSATAFTTSSSSPSLWQQFNAYCERQDKTNYLFWTALTIGVQACVLSPVALWTISHFQLNDLFLLLAVSSIFAVIIPNLSALSTKVILPIFSASVLVHGLIVLVGLIG